MVRRVTTWRDRIVEMSEYEAVEFCATAKREVGLNYREDWVELLVTVGRGVLQLQARNVEILEGRDYGKTEGLEAAFT